jgi:hypothetical protein
MALSITNTHHDNAQNYAGCRYAECCVLFIVMMSVIMLKVIMLSVVMLNVIMVSVVMLNVILVSVVMLNVVILSVMVPIKRSVPNVNNFFLL